jgi:TP901 family phage tail tape measure protein
MASMAQMVLKILVQGADTARSAVSGLGSDVNRLSGHTSGTNTTMGAFGSTLTNIGGSMQNAGRTMTNTITRGVVELGLGAISAAMDFEKGMLRVQAMAGATAEDTVKLGDKAKEMALKTKFAATEVADGFYYMASAGWKTSDMLVAIEGTTALAAASGEDLAKTTDILVGSIQAFGLKASDASRVADVLANTARNSNTNVAMLGQAFKYVAPVAGALKYSIEDVNLALGIMASNNIKASQAGTTLRAGLVRLSAPPKAAAVAMKDLGISVTDSKGKMLPLAGVIDQLRDKFKGLNPQQKTAAANAIFGKTAMAGWLAIINSSPETIKKMTDATTNYNGAAQNMADIQLQGLSGQMQILKSTIELVAIKMGDLMVPYVKLLAQWLNTLFTNFQKVSPSIQRMIVVIGIIAAAMGPVLLVGGLLVSAIGSIVTAVAGIAGAVTAAGGITAFLGGIASAAAPVLIVVGIIAALVAVVALIITRMFSWNQILAGIKSAFNSLKSAFMFVVNFLKDTFTPVVESFKKTFMAMDTKAIVKSFNQMKDSMGPLIEIIKAVASIIGIALAAAIGIIVGVLNGLLAALAPFVAMLMNIIGVVTSLFGIVVGVFTGDMDMINKSVDSLCANVIGLFYNLGMTVYNFVMGFVDGIVAFFTGLYTTLVGASIIPDMVNAIIMWFMNLITQAFALFNTMLTTLISIVTSIYTGVVNLITYMVTGVVSLISGIVTTVSSLFRTMLSTVVSIATSIYTSVVNAFTNLVSGIAGKVSSAVTAATNVINGVKNAIATVASNAYTWGANLIQTFINGITSKIAAVGNAVGNVVGTVKSFLGFQSPAEKGPGAEADEWAPNLMKMVTGGLLDGLPEITRASDLIASKLNFIPARQVANNSGNTTSQSVVINIDAAHMGVEELGNALVGKLQNYGIKPQKGY